MAISYHRVAGDGWISLLMLKHSHRMLICYAIASFLAFAQVGCVALNIPSQRHHDPGDQGGLFGSWGGDHRSEACRDPLQGQDACVEGGGSSCGAATCQSCDFEGVDPEVKLPEIPWPRFHPVPTRPVFGSPSAR